MVTFSPAGDFGAIVDGLATVTYRDRDGNDTSVEKTLRRAITRKEAAASDGKYTTDDVVFHLSTAIYSSRPALGAEIIDDEGNWRILEVAKQTLNHRWRCTCRELSITAGLDTLVTIQQATYAKGIGGALEPTWNNQYTNRRAKVQLISGDRSDQHDHKQIERTAKVYFAEQLLLTTNQRIIDSAGTIYKVIGWQEPDSISELYVANCEVTQWPLA